MKNEFNKVNKQSVQNNVKILSFLILMLIASGKSNAQGRGGFRTSSKSNGYGFNIAKFLSIACEGFSFSSVNHKKNLNIANEFNFDWGIGFSHIKSGEYDGQQMFRLKCSEKLAFRAAKGLDVGVKLSAGHSLTRLEYHSSNVFDTELGRKISVDEFNWRNFSVVGGGIFAECFFGDSRTSSFSVIVGCDYNRMIPLQKLPVSNQGIELNLYQPYFGLNIYIGR